MGSAYTGNARVIIRCSHQRNSSLLSLLFFKFSAFLINLHEIINILILLGQVRINHKFTLMSVNSFLASLREGYDFVLNWESVKDLQHEKRIKHDCN